MRPSGDTSHGAFALTLTSERTREWYLKLTIIGVAFALTIVHIVSVHGAIF